VLDLNQVLFAADRDIIQRRVADDFSHLGIRLSVSRSSADDGLTSLR
jgi:hypothetical protein